MPPALPPAPRRLAAKPVLGWWLFASLPLLLLLAGPIATVILGAPLASLGSVLTSPQALDALRISLVTSLSATGLAVLLGTPLAFVLARGTFAGRALLDSLVDLPMVLPPSVAGIALLLMVGRQGWLGGWLDAWGWQVAFTPTAVILAQLFVAAPYYVRAAAIGFAGVDRELEQAAALDGGHAWQVWRYITVPLSWPALVGGAVTCWARALGEFGATIIVAGNMPGRTQTMPLAIYLGFEQDLSLALALAVLLVAVSFLVLIGMRRRAPGRFGPWAA